MFTREMFDTILPPGELLEAAVKRSLIECFDVPETSLSDLAWLLTVMERFYERHAAYSPTKTEPWQKLHSPEFENDWTHSISFRGLDYKPRSNYMTLEGWPTGTTCWFITVEYGWREQVTAPTPQLAVFRAIVVMCAAFRVRKTAPSKRRDVIEIMKQIMQET